MPKKSRRPATRRLGGYTWVAISSPGRKVAWNEERGRYHIVQTFGLEPWELYEGNTKGEPK